MDESQLTTLVVVELVGFIAVAVLLFRAYVERVKIHNTKLGNEAEVDKLRELADLDSRRIVNDAMAEYRLENLDLRKRLQDLEVSNAIDRTRHDERYASLKLTYEVRTDELQKQITTLTDKVKNLEAQLATEREARSTAQTNYDKLQREFEARLEVSVAKYQAQIDELQRKLTECQDEAPST